MTTDARCAGRRAREMVCNGCHRMFTADEASWKSAESRPCPYCRARDTTPMLSEYHAGSRPVYARDARGGYI